jgi:two-component sensor histidine kinase
MGKEGSARHPLTRLWLGWFGWPGVGTPLAWLLAVILIVVGGVLKPLLELVGGEPLPTYITLYPAVVVAALGGGPVVGVATAIITLAAACLFSTSFPATVVYACTSVFLGWIVGSARLVFDEANANRKRQEYAARESVHRIRNLIAVSQAIIRKVFHEVKTTEEYRDILCERMRGLDIAQGILLEHDWQNTPLSKLIESALAPFLPNPGLTLRRGPEAMIPAECVRGLSMALYELCTNSMKYGALAEGRGPVLLSWKIEDGKVMVEWEEKTATDPRHTDSFGATLIRVALAGDQNARVDYRVDPSSVYASFEWHGLGPCDDGKNNGCR